MGLHITDDFTGKPLRHPFISLGTARINFEDGFEWIGGAGEVYYFQNPTSLKNWAEEKILDACEKRGVYAGKAIEV